MATLTNPLFAEEDFSAFSPDVTRVRVPVLHGWDDEKALVPPSPLLTKSETKRLQDRRKGSGDVGGTRGTKDRELQRTRVLQAKNDKLEGEIESLRNTTTLKSNEALATKANALRHLKSVEEHVHLLMDESKRKIDALAAEMEKENDLGFAGGGGVDEKSNDSNVMRRDMQSASHSVYAPHESSAVAEAIKLRTELNLFSQREAELDAEAEEREEELAQAVERIQKLEEALRLAGGVME